MKSLAELDAIRDSIKNKIDLREADKDRTKIVVGMATCGIEAGARDVMVKLLEELDSKNVGGVSVTQMGCIGLCRVEPVVEVYTNGSEKTTYVNMTPDKIKRVVEEHIIGGNPIEEYTIGAVQTGGK